MTAGLQGVEELLARWNNHTRPETTSTAVAGFVAQAARTPDALALVAGETRLTYRELSGRVFAVAQHLRDLGVRAEDVVGIGMPRSAEMVVAVLGVMVAGGAFVPVDPAWPARRREQVLAEARARLVLTDLPPGAADDPGIPIAPGQLAYVIFTSGSTGTPKGAMIRHEAIAERLRWQVEHVLHFGPGDASLFKAPLSFDISVNEILLPLVSGGYVVVAEPGA